MTRSGISVHAKRIAVVVLVTAGLSWLALLGDDAARDWFRAPGFNGTPRNHLFRPILENAVEIQLYIAVPAILLSFSNRRQLLIGWMVVVLLSVLLTHSLKFAVGRARPHMDQDPSATVPLNTSAKHQSFPSGHTSAAVANAVLLGLYFPRGRFAFWILAAAMGAERMRVEAHFLSDIVAGAGIGVLAVLLGQVLLRNAVFFQPAVKDDQPQTSNGNA